MLLIQNAGKGDGVGRTGVTEDMRCKKVQMRVADCECMTIGVKYNNMQDIISCI